MNIMLDKKDAKKVINLLMEMDAYFEVSPRGGFVNIYSPLDEEEEAFVNSFLDTL